MMLHVNDGVNMTALCIARSAFRDVVPLLALLVGPAVRAETGRASWAFGGLTMAPERWGPYEAHE